jgi:hypothetical protein
MRRAPERWLPLCCLVLLGGCGREPSTAVEKPPFRHYVAAVLTQDSQRQLLARVRERVAVPAEWTFVAHHMTIAPPGDDAYRLLTKDYPVRPGGKIELRAVAYAMDDKALAAAVTLAPDYAALKGTNKDPHVTVAVAPGAKAFYSNHLLAEKPRTAFDPPVVLTAHVCLVSADSKTCVPDVKGLAEDLRRFDVFLRPRNARAPGVLARGPGFP